MKKWLVTNVTSVQSRDRAECELLGMIFNAIWPIQITIVAREHHCDMGIPSRALLTSLRTI